MHTKNKVRMKEVPQQEKSLEINKPEETPIPSDYLKQANKEQTKESKKGLSGNEILNKLFEQEGIGASPNKETKNLVMSPQRKNSSENKPIKNNNNKISRDIVEIVEDKKISNTHSNILIHESTTLNVPSLEKSPLKAPVKSGAHLNEHENYLFQNIINPSELHNEQVEVNNTTILQLFRNNTLVFLNEKNGSIDDLKLFLSNVNENDQQIMELFNLINKELRQDLIDCQEDLKILNDELHSWQLAGMLVDVHKTHMKMNASLSWMDFKKKQVQTSIEQFSSTTNNIKNYINMYYQNKVDEKETN